MWSADRTVRLSGAAALGTELYSGFLTILLVSSEQFFTDCECKRRVNRRPLFPGHVVFLRVAFDVRAVFCSRDKMPSFSKFNSYLKPSIIYSRFETTVSLRTFTFEFP
jgi:hypothetical protein